MVAPTDSLEVVAGTTVTYVCVGFGGDDPPNISWQFNNTLLGNDTSALVTVYESQVVENSLTFTQSILELCSVDVDDSGEYSCIASNSGGSNSSSFILDVKPRSKKAKKIGLIVFQYVLFLVAAAIVIRPNVTEPFTEGDTVSLVCTASGRPYPMIQWYKDGVLITNESLTFIYNEEFESNDLLFTSSILELCSVDEDDVGTYSCRASNSAGNDSIEFDIAVQLGS